MACPAGSHKPEQRVQRASHLKLQSSKLKDVPRRREKLPHPFRLTVGMTKIPQNHLKYLNASLPPGVYSILF